MYLGRTYPTRRECNPVATLVPKASAWLALGHIGDGAEPIGRGRKERRSGAVLRPLATGGQVEVALWPDLSARLHIAALPAARATVEVAQGRDLRLGPAGEHEHPQVGLDEGIPYSPRSPNQSVQRGCGATAWCLILTWSSARFAMARRSRSLGVCSIGIPWCSALLSASACSCSRMVATGTLWLLVVWPGQVSEIRCGAPSKSWVVCGDGAQGALA